MPILGRRTTTLVGPAAMKARVLSGLAAVLLTGTLAAPVLAHADPQMDDAICQYFNNHGGVNGDNLRDLSQGLHDSGLSVDQYNLAIVSAVKNSCPTYRNALVEWLQRPW